MARRREDLKLVARGRGDEGSECGGGGRTPLSLVIPRGKEGVHKTDP